MSDNQTVFTALYEHGLLLMQDKRLRSVSGILAGEPVSGSWWSHAKAQEIYACLGWLSDHPDVLVCRLVGGKVTFLHRRLWTAFLAVAGSGEDWQEDGLSPDARTLLHAVLEGSPLRTRGEAARELQRRLLVHAEEIHTEAGRHEVALQPWTAWAEGRGVTAACRPDDGRAALEGALAAIGGKPDLLPWHPGAR